MGRGCNTIARVRENCTLFPSLPLLWETIAGAGSGSEAHAIPLISVLNTIDLGTVINISVINTTRLYSVCWCKLSFFSSISVRKIEIISLPV